MDPTATGSLVRPAKASFFDPLPRARKKDPMMVPKRLPRTPGRDSPGDRGDRRSGAADVADGGDGVVDAVAPPRAGSLLARITTPLAGAMLAYGLAGMASVSTPSMASSPA